MSPVREVSKLQGGVGTGTAFKLFNWRSVTDHRKLVSIRPRDLIKNAKMSKQRSLSLGTFFKSPCIKTEDQTTAVRKEPSRDAPPPSSSSNPKPTAMFETGLG